MPEEKETVAVPTSLLQELLNLLKNLPTLLADVEKLLHDINPPAPPTA